MVSEDISEKVALGQKMCRNGDYYQVYIDTYVNKIAGYKFSIP
jgi:hypothetical protein